MTETHKAAVEGFKKWLLGDEVNGGFIRTVAYTVWNNCHHPTHEDGNSDWFNDNLPTVNEGRKIIEEKLDEAIRTLKQPSSVEVTVEKKQYYRSREFYIEYFASVLCRMDDLDPKRWREGSETFEWTEFEQHAECILDAILQDFPSALRITRAAATDGVK